MSNFQALQDYAADMKELAGQIEQAAMNHRWVELLAMDVTVHGLICKSIMRLIETPPSVEPEKEQYGMPIDKPAAETAYQCMLTQMEELQDLMAPEAKASTPESAGGQLGKAPEGEAQEGGSTDE